MSAPLQIEQPVDISIHSQKGPFELFELNKIAGGQNPEVCTRKQFW
jgi:hypothetical protein